MSGRAVVAFAAALVVVLCVGLWLGGHPAKLPAFLRDAFVDDSAGLNVEATEAIEDNYFRDGRHDRADQRLAAGDGPRAAPRATTTASPTTSRRKPWRASTKRSPGASRGSASR